MSAEKKYKYAISQSADGMTSGYIVLTKKEAALVARTLDTNNWLDLEQEPWSGWCYLDVSNPIPLPKSE